MGKRSGTIIERRKARSVGAEVFNKPDKDGLSQRDREMLATGYRCAIGLSVNYGMPKDLAKIVLGYGIAAFLPKGTKEQFDAVGALADGMSRAIVRGVVTEGHRIAPASSEEVRKFAN